MLIQVCVQKKAKRAAHLEAVVEDGPLRKLGVGDDAFHVLCCFCFSQVRFEAISESVDRDFPCERGQVGRHHQPDGGADLFYERSAGQESFHCELPEVVEPRTRYTSHDVDHLMGQLEGVWFEFNALDETSHWIRSSERKVN